MMWVAACCGFMAGVGVMFYVWLACLSGGEGGGYSSGPAPLPLLTPRRPGVRGGR
jgi:hypothetical protein